MSKPTDGEEDVDNVLAEAQALMEEMNASNDEEGVSSSLVIDGFSIDDILGDDSNDNIVDARTSSSEAAAAAAGTTPSNITKVEIGDDPLSLIASPPPAAATANTADKPRRSSLTMHPLQDEQVKVMSGAPSAATLPSAPSLADVKARATGFASSMASFAQKAAANVAAAANSAAEDLNTANGGSLTNIGSLPTSPQPLPSALVELDNDQKTALIAQHLGDLLPGERVIMFLSNLLHVSDSSGWDYTSAAASNGTWCCCMTFYRVVLFHTGTMSQLQPQPSDWDDDCWPTMPGRCMLQMPLGSMDRVEKSIYTTSQNTTLMGLVMYGYVFRSTCALHFRVLLSFDGITSSVQFF